MTVTANDIKRLRSMINEPTSVTYTDADLTTLIENAAIPDNFQVKRTGYPLITFTR